VLVQFGPEPARPVLWVVAAISWTMVLKLRKGLPRQLRVIKENRAMFDFIPFTGAGGK